MVDTVAKKRLVRSGIDLASAIAAAQAILPSYTMGQTNDAGLNTEEEVETPL